jgi:FkbM family methyltransferase
VSALRNIGSAIADHPLTRDRQLATWLRFGSWAVRSRLNGELTLPWIEGQRLAVRRGMTGATGNLYLGLHEFMSMALTVHFLREGDLFFDVGANVGSYTVLASGIARARTWAFEPDPGTARDFSRNVETNALGDRVVLHQVAVGPADGEVSFTQGEGAMNRVEAGAAQTVPQRAIDSLTGGAAPSMIKLDVEGYEEQALLGARRTLANPALKVIAMEGTTPSILQLFADNGLERAFYDPFTRVLQRTPNSLAYADGKWTLSNEFYVRDWEFVSERLKTARPITVFGSKI